MMCNASLRSNQPSIVLATLISRTRYRHFDNARQIFSSSCCLGQLRHSTRQKAALGKLLRERERPLVGRARILAAPKPPVHIRPGRVRQMVVVKFARCQNGVNLRISRARPWPRSGHCAKAVIVGGIGRLRLIARRLTFHMRGNPKSTKRPLERPLDGSVGPRGATPDLPDM